MSIKRVLATAAMAMGLVGGGVVVTAAPANATIYNQTCTNNYQGVQILDATNNAWYCYAWDGNINGTRGWANISRAVAMCTGVNGGYLIDFNNNIVETFNPGEGCFQLSHQVSVRWVVISQ